MEDMLLTLEEAVALCT